MLNLQEIGLQSVSQLTDMILILKTETSVSLSCLPLIRFSATSLSFILSKASFNFPTVASVPLLCIHCTRNSTQHSLVMWRFSSSIIFMVLWRKRSSLARSFHLRPICSGSWLSLISLSVSWWLGSRLRWTGWSVTNIASIAEANWGGC